MYILLGDRKILPRYLKSKVAIWSKKKGIEINMLGFKPILTCKIEGENISVQKMVYDTNQILALQRSMVTSAN